MRRRYDALAAAVALLLAACTDWHSATDPRRGDPTQRLTEVSATQVTYQYTGHQFQTFCSGLFGRTEVCSTSPEGTSYSAGDFMTALITLDAPLPPNLLLENVVGYPGF